MQPDQGAVHRLFVETPGGPGAQVVPWEDVHQAVVAEPATATALRDLVKQKTEPIDWPIKKMSQGATIVYGNPGDVLTAASTIIGERPTFLDRQHGTGARRMVRTITLMRVRFAELAASKTAFVRELATQVSALVGELTKPADAQRKMIELVASARAEWRKDNRHVWLAFSLLSQFGPLSHQLISDAGSNPDENALNQQLTKDLRGLRMVMSRTENVGVVAHRGAGPTNRTMGKLIADDDNRRTNRPAENSPAAFADAMTHASTTAKNTGLDGVECDIFLSKDGKPIVTHEANLKEQVRIARQAAFTGGAHVYERNAADILAMQRTDVADSAFISFDQLLTLVLPCARSFYTATGRPFRLEIEMKGSATAFGGKGGKYEDKISPDAKARLGTTGHFLRVAVAKELSQLKKRSLDVPIDFVLFNGVESDGHDFAGVRRTKVALGDITVALGSGPDKTLPTEGRLGQDVDELRFMLYAALKDKTWMTGVNGRFILTGVSGQEFAPAELKLSAWEPSLELLDPSRTEIKASLTKRAAGRAVPDEVELAGVIRKIKAAEIDVAHFRLLTDYAAKAAYLKRVIGAVRPPVAATGPAVRTAVLPVGDTTPKKPGAGYRAPTIDTARPIVGATTPVIATATIGSPKKKRKNVKKDPGSTL